MTAAERLTTARAELERQIGRMNRDLDRLDTAALAADDIIERVSFALKALSVKERLLDLERLLALLDVGDAP